MVDVTPFDGFLGGFLLAAPLGALWGIDAWEAVNKPVRIGWQHEGGPALAVRVAW